MDIRVDFVLFGYVVVQIYAVSITIRIVVTGIYSLFSLNLDCCVGGEKEEPS